MWQFIFIKALVMFAQATVGSPLPAKPAPAEVMPPEPTGSSFRSTPWETVLLIIYFIICVGLVIAVLLQTTKSEGLSGVIGGSAQSVFRGKKGFEERLQEVTNYLAISFIVMSLLVSLFAFRNK